MSSAPPATNRQWLPGKFRRLLHRCPRTEPAEPSRKEELPILKEAVWGMRAMAHRDRPMFRVARDTIGAEDQGPVAYAV
jgi:hypothetical protein